MPRVPLPQESIAVRPAGAFTAFRTRPQGNAFPSQITRLGGAVEAAGAATADIADVIQDDFDTARATEGFNLWNEKNRETLYDEEGGYLGKQGKDATGAGRKEAQARIIQEAEDISTGLDNEAQKGVYRRFVNNRMGEVLTQMDRHELTQVKVYRAGQQQAMQRASVGDSAKAFLAGDLETYVVQKGVSVQRARDIADSLGYSDEQEAEFVQVTTTAIHAGVIEELIAEGRGDEAGAYLDGVDIEEITPQERPKLKARVQRAAMDNRAARKALDVIDFVDKEVQDVTPLQLGEGLQILGDPTVEAPEDRLMSRGRDILEQQFRAGEITIEERDATLARIKEESQFRRDVRVTQATDSLIEAQQWLDENRRSGVAQLPPDLYEDLRDNGQLAAINLFADQRRYTTDPQVYASLLDMRRNPSLLRKPNGDLMTEGEFFLTYRPHLEDRHLNQVMAGFRVVTGTGSAEDESIYTPAERINFELRQAGVEDEDDIARSERIIQQRVNEATPPGGDRPRGEALKPIIDSVLLDRIRVPESFLGIDILNPDTVLPANLLTPEQIAAGEVDVDGFVVRLRDIPPDRFREIEQGLRARGVPASFNTIARVWLREVEALRRRGRGSPVRRNQ